MSHMSRGIGARGVVHHAMRPQGLFPVSFANVGAFASFVSSLPTQHERLSSCTSHQGATN